MFTMLCCVAYVTDARDWRAHLDQMQKYRSGIDEALATTKGQLDKLHSDISHMLEKIGSREKYLNSQLEPLLIQYRALQVSSDSMVQYVAPAGTLFTLQVSSESRVQCVALLVALQVTGTVGFSVLHCLRYRSEVTGGIRVLHLWLRYRSQGR